MAQAIRYMNGFEDGDTTSLALEVGTKSSTCTITTGGVGPRSGSKFLQCGADNSGNFIGPVLDAQQFWSVGYGHNYSGSQNRILTFISAGTIVATITLDGSGHFQLYSGALSVLRATSSGTIPANQWYHLAVVIKLDTTSGGYCNIHLNGNTTPFLSYTGITATATTADQVGPWHFGGGGAALFDDLYIATGDAGSAAANYLGDLTITSLLPSGAGNSTQFTPSAGSNYQCVDDAAPNGATDYVEDSVSGHKDTYAMADLSISGTVIAVQPWVTAAKDVAGTISFKTVTRYSGTEVDGAAQAPGTSYVVGREDAYLTKPGGGAWDVSSVNAMEVGLKIV